jgi:hypothetical protein
MTPAVTRWLEALESGKYKKGKWVLHAVKPNRPDTFCCLGVACKISNLVVPICREERVEQNIVYGHSNILAPNNVRDELGLSTNDGAFNQTPETRKVFNYPENEGLSSLALLNDSGATFEQIAQIIRLSPPGLFRRVDDAQV